MIWYLSVYLDSVDVTSRLTGIVEVEAEASRARVASFTLFPSSGTIDVGDWIRAPVTIDFIESPGAGQTVTRLFTGYVSLPVYDPVTRIARFECTDDFQGICEAMTEAQILSAITDGKYSVPIFGNREDGWQQMLDVLSTVPKDYDLDRDGSTATLTNWAAKATPDFSYSASTILDKSVKTELIRLRDLINKVELSFEYRFTRLHHREHTFSYSAYAPGNGAYNFCDFYFDSYDLPTRDMITSAASGAGWNIKNKNIDFDTQPVTDTYLCGTEYVAWLITSEALETFMVGADWTAVKRWSQTVTETYTMTVQEAGSITKFGESIYEDGAGHHTEFDDGGFDATEDTDIPTGFSVNGIGDYTLDKVDRTESDNAIETLLQVADVKIKDSHRQNYVAFVTPIEPSIERSHTVAMDSGTVQAKGKVFKTQHICDLDEGTAKTEIRIAVSKTGAGGSSDTLTAPSPPSTAPVHTPPASSHPLPNRIGNDDTASNYDETWQGFTGNFSAPHGSPTEDQIYPIRFRIDTDDVEDEVRQELQAETLVTFNVQVPDETLTISA